jgi:P4 family phage/plasmid primase-like protien
MEYKDFNEFMSKHYTKKDATAAAVASTHTHTRIGDTQRNIYGGSYLIPQDAIPTFYNLYYDHVFKQKKMEYLTEKQIENGPILIDIDLRYDHNVETRQHTKEHIIDLINLMYLEELKKFFVFEPNTPIPIYVFEKQTVNRLSDGSLTKDGIHMIIGIQMNHTLQTMLRENIVNKIGDIWDLPIINTWDSVLDEGISKGTTNWQLYGSRKPGNQAYELTQYYSIEFDKRDSEFMFEEKKVSDIDLSKDFVKLTARYTDHNSFEMQPKIKEEYEKRKSKTSKTSSLQSNSKTKFRLLCEDVETNSEDKIIQLEDIKDAATLKLAVDKILSRLSMNEYYVKEAHEYAQILPEKYYEPGSHLLNRQVAFALKHTDERLFLSWVMIRSKSSDFDYDTIPQLYTQWTKYFKEKPNGVTIRSIMYWAKQDAFEAFEKVKRTTRDYYIEQTIDSPTDFDFAMVLFQMFKDKYICSSLMSKTWYIYKNHRWEIDRGQTLRMAISVDMVNAYQDKQIGWTNELQHFDPEDDRYTALSNRLKRITDLIMKLKRTTDKNNIMREAQELFFDADFDKQMDSNKWLLCFKNGVVDLKQKIFREGYPQDYITKSTNIVYESYCPDKHGEIGDKIMEFMDKLFPVKTLNAYMWSHLSSTLIGENINQTFNIYKGSGSNGKSILTDLMELSLGDYYGTVPITLVTEKRPGIGGTTSEIIQLKGVRFAVMQEPSKDARINEGMMKQLTGDSKLSGRALYHETETFMIQFHLVVCTNQLFEINSNDDGTWRRIRICEFMSKFVDPDSPPLQNEPYQFPKDKNLKDKLKDWASVFISMLVKLAFENQGIVEACDIVKASSNRYREGQDHIAAFVNEHIVKATYDPESGSGCIKKQDLSDRFNDWFRQEQGNRKVPKGSELNEYMDIRFGKCQKLKKKSTGTGWLNLCFRDQAAECDEVDTLPNI